jgi:uncharacterized sulfatase
LEIGRKSLEPVFEFARQCRRDRVPFFVWYAPMMPHQPHDPPDALLRRHAGTTTSLHVEKYWAMVEWFDATCGKLLAFLDREGAATNTVVVYVTDNGWIQDPNQPRFAVRSKQSPYDTGLRTPILLRWPGQIQARRSPELAMSIDLAPTLLRLAGLDPTPEMPGVDLLDARRVAGRTRLFGECFTHNAVDIQQPASNLRWRWVIESDWKLIVPAPQNQAGEDVQLFRLGLDPQEMRNLAARETSRVNRMRGRLDAWWDGRVLEQP